MDMDDLIICRCEEVTENEIREAIKLGLTTTNELKRLTRAGMGLCQGKTCGRLVMSILTRETHQPPDQVEPATSRPPTRVIALEVLANSEKDAE